LNLFLQALTVMRVGRVVAVTTRLRTGLPRDRVLIPGRDKIFSFSPKHSRHLGGPLNLLFDDFRCAFPGGKAVCSWHRPRTAIHCRG